MSVVETHRSSEMDRFDAALKQAMSVSKEDLIKILAEEKAAKADKPKRGPKASNRER